MDAFAAAKTIASTLIISQESELTMESIRACVTQACSLSPANQLSDVERAQLVRELEISFQTIIGEERQLVGDDEGWDYWLPDRKGRVKWDYWSRYEEYLRHGPMNKNVRDRLDSSTDRTLGLLGDPRRAGSWDRRGLVVGLVQSGKTSHYVGLINKAVDTGYKVIVILTGFTESLRVQTQIRAEEGFLGYYLQPGDVKGEMRSYRVGVGEIAPGRNPDSVTTRSHDFRKAIADNFGIQVGGKEILFVIKKNVSVLRNLLNWIENLGNATDSYGRRYVKDVPVLVIDDESDVGSIDTKKGNIIDDDPDPEHEPSRINEQIRKLLSLFDQSSYVGYTATPFANVLIHDAGRTDELGEDLFPRSFILSLPTPSDHMGPSMVFGRNEDGIHKPGLPIVKHIPDKEASGETAWVPPVHKKNCVPMFNGREEIPPSLRKAILSFILTCTARRIRDTGTKHNSMLVHVTRFVDVQEKVDRQVSKELKGVVDRLIARTADKALLQEMKDLWIDDFMRTTTKIAEKDKPIFQNPVHEWKDIQAEIPVLAAAIQVRSINGEAGEVLDYEKHKNGLNVIAVGGDKLSRGLTLDGLSISYFTRCSRMYDTLMQMGRWFGYRPGYLDLCRLYAPSELCDWFTKISDATEELRREFDLMAASGGTPKDFGLKVRSHPELLVTSRVKGRHGKKIAVTFQGKFVETDNFYRDATTAKANWTATESLIKSLETGAGAIVDPPRNGCAMWINVQSHDVTDFLSQYKEHEAAYRARTGLLKEYIEKEVQKGRLNNWTVLISGGSGYGATISETSFDLVRRGWKTTSETEEEKEEEIAGLKKNNKFRIGILVNPPDEAVDLDKDAIEAARLATISEWESDPRGRDKPPKSPAGRFLREQRDPQKGLLVLYLLDPGDGRAEDENVPLVGFVISFPSVHSVSASQVTYTVNNVFQQQELGI